MTWPGWTDVLPLLTVIAALLGAAWAWARLSDRTVSRAVEKAGKESTDAARQATDDLYERLRTNDFQHVEAEIESGLKAVGERLDRVEAHGREDRKAMEARIADRMGRMEGRLLAAIQGRAPEAPESPEDPA